MNPIILSASPLPIINAFNITNTIKALNENKMIRVLKMILKKNFIYALLSAPVI